MNQQPDLFTGLDLQEKGIKAVSAKYPEDKARLIDFAIRWIRNQTSPFTWEDIKKAYLQSYPLAHFNLNGAAASDLSRRGIIKHVGSTNATLPSAHGRLIRTWEAA